MKDLFVGISEVLNPAVIYEGNYGFPIETLYSCSKMEDKRNLVSEYFYIHYLKSLFSLLNGFDKVIDRIYLVSDLNKTKSERVLRISLELITQEICVALVGDGPDLKGDYSDFKEVVSNFFMNYKKAITCLEEGKDNEDLKKYIERINNLYIRNENYRKSVYGKKYVPLNFYEYLKNLRSKIVEFLIVYNRLVNLCDKEVNLNELEELLDLDKFYFSMAIVLVETSKIAEKVDGKLQHSFVFVEVYIKRLMELMNRYGYKISMDVVLPDGRKVKASDEYLINEYNMLRNRHPEFKTVVIDRDDSIDYHDLDTTREIFDIIDAAVKSKELEVSWRLFKKGEKLESSSILSDVGVRSPKKELSIEEKNSELRKRIDFFESSPFLYRVEGINNFEGYIGYIYPNGYVIFEKFYKNCKTFELAEIDATYVMTITNFIELSKLTKPQIIRYIKDGNTDVMRKYHTSSWEDRLSKIINGNGYDANTMSIIDSLVKSGELSKKEVKV